MAAKAADFSRLRALFPACDNREMFRAIGEGAGTLRIGNAADTRPPTMTLLGIGLSFRDDLTSDPRTSWETYLAGL